MKTIYIPVSVEKELPEDNPMKPIKHMVVFGGNLWFAKYTRGHWYLCEQIEDTKLKEHELPQLTHWLKPIEVESLIQHVESCIAPQREDMREYAKEGIISFFNKFLTKNQ